jgi:hypothetical protein
VLWQQSGQPVVLVAQTVVQGKTLERNPVILQVSCKARFAEVGVWVSKALDVKIWLTVGQRSEIRKNIQAPEPV